MDGTTGGRVSDNPTIKRSDNPLLVRALQISLSYTLAGLLEFVYYFFAAQISTGQEGPKFKTVHKKV